MRLLLSLVLSLTSPAPGYVIRWANGFNTYEVAHHHPLRIVGFAHCEKEGEAVSVCVPIVVNEKTGFFACYRVRIDTVGRVFPPIKLIDCKHPVNLA